MTAAYIDSEHLQENSLRASTVVIVDATIISLSSSTKNKARYRNLQENANRLIVACRIYQFVNGVKTLVASNIRHMRLISPMVQNIGKIGGCNGQHKVKCEFVAQISSTAINVAQCRC